MKMMTKTWNIGRGLSNAVVLLCCIVIFHCCCCSCCCIVCCCCVFFMLPVACSHHLLHHHHPCCQPPLLVPIMLYCCVVFLFCIVVVVLLVVLFVCVLVVLVVACGMKSLSSLLSPYLQLSSPACSNHVVLLCGIFILHCSCCCCCCAVIMAITLYLLYFFVLLFLFLLLLLLSLTCSHHLLCHHCPLSSLSSSSLPLSFPSLLSQCIVVLHCCCNVGAFVHYYFGVFVLFAVSIIICLHHYLVIYVFDHLFGQFYIWCYKDGWHFWCSSWCFLHMTLFCCYSNYWPKANW